MSTTKRWWADLVLVAAFVALTVALINGHLLEWDQRVADWAFAFQPRPLHWVARVLNYLGQGGQVLTPVALILTAILTRRTRSVRAVLPFLAALVLTYVTVGPLKLWAGRAAPTFTGPDKTVMFNPYASGVKALSYPSGHLANSVVWYAVIALLVAALLSRPLTVRETVLIRVVPVVVVFGTTIYTGFHWFTDSVAGVLLGLFLARLIGRVPFDAVPLPALRGWNRPAGFGHRPAVTSDRAAG
jgi:membrane-associated phospholipid phosphatase